MSGVDIAGLVEELHGVLVCPSTQRDIMNRAADALLAQAAELAEARAYHQDALQQLAAARDQRDEALAALKASEEALDERIDTAWADGARFVVNELDSLIPDSTLVRDKLVDIDQMIARRYADAIASRKERRARSVLENGSATLADATNNPPSDPGTEQREAGV